MNEQLTLEVSPVPEPTLDNFIVGQNAEAINTLRHLLSGQAVYLWGSNGCGKTHLLKAMAASQQGAYFNHKSQPFLASITFQNTPRLVAVDGIESLSEDQQAELFSLYNEWKLRKNTSDAFMLLVSGNVSPLAMPIREDLRTRLGWELVYRLEQLSDEQRLTALQNRAREKGLQLSHEVTHWIFTHYSRDIAALFNLLDALDTYSLSTRRPITVPLLKAFFIKTKS